MRFAFFGSSRFSCLVLAELVQTPHAIACVVTQPDQPAGRHMELTPTVVNSYARERELPVLTPRRLRGDNFLNTLRSYNPDALLVASYGKILPLSTLELTAWPLNVHPSLLPALRGPSPVRTALLQGLEVTGCCIMRMTPRLDDGDILLSQKLAIDTAWNFESLETELGKLGGQLATRALSLAEQGTAKFTPQDHTRATVSSLFTKDDSRIDWARSAHELSDFVRAWDPDVGAWTVTPEGRRLKVWKVRVSAAPADAISQQSVRRPCSIVAVQRQAIWVGCGANEVLELLELQPENRKRMPVGSFIAGSRLEAGMQLAAG